MWVPRVAREPAQPLPSHRLPLGAISLALHVPVKVISGGQDHIPRSRVALTPTRVGALLPAVGPAWSLASCSPEGSQMGGCPPWEGCKEASAKGVHPSGGDT